MTSRVLPGLGHAGVHAMDTGMAHADWPALQEQELAGLAQHFPELRSALPGTTPRVLWASPRPFAASARVQTRAGEFFVKRHDARVRDVPALLEEHRFAAHLGARGIDVPRALADGAGCTAVAVGNWTYEVHAIVAGVDAYRDVQSWVPVRSNDQARALGRCLAQLHLASVGFDAPARAPRPLLASLDIIARADLAQALETFVATRPAVLGFLESIDAHWRATICAAMARPHALLQPLVALLAPLWVHNDLHASNVFWTDRSEQASARSVIDFGLCNRGWAVADLATALERNTIAWLESDPARMGRIPLALSLLEGYCALRPLGTAERQALPLLLELAHLEYSLSEVDYFWGITRNERNATLAYQDFLLGHVRWFGSRAGREYLDALRLRLREGPL